MPLSLSKGAKKSPTEGDAATACRSAAAPH